MGGVGGLVVGWWWCGGQIIVMRYEGGGVYNARIKRDRNAKRDGLQ